MKYIKYILIFVILITALSPVFSAQASVVNPNEPCNAPVNPTNLPCVYGTTPAGSGYHLLAPLPSVGPDFDPTDDTALGKYLNLMITVFIGLCAVLAVVMIVIGGIEYMTSELLSSKAAGRERMTNAVLGLLIALGAYALLYTINPDILQTDLKSLTQATLTVTSVDKPQGCTNGTCGGYTEGVNWATIAGSLPSSFPPNVTIQNGECTTVGQTNCTSIRGLQTGYVTATQQGCGCPLTITGGTESWLHSAGTAHEPGSPVVDLALTSALTTYIMGNNTQPVLGTRYSKNGVSYLFEGDHWHVGG